MLLAALPLWVNTACIYMHNSYYAQLIQLSLHLLSLLSLLPPAIVSAYDSTMSQCNQRAQHAWQVGNKLPDTRNCFMLQGEDLLRDLLSIQVPVELNVAFCERHLTNCAPSEQLTKECTHVSPDSPCLVASAPIS